MLFLSSSTARLDVGGEACAGVSEDCGELEADVVMNELLSSGGGGGGGGGHMLLGTDTTLLRFL